MKEVHAFHLETKEEFTLRSIELSGKHQHIYDYMQQELTILKWLNHPSIIRCHRIFKTSNHLYFVYDNLPGYSLTELFQGNCSFHRVLDIIKGLLDVLAYLDQRDIIIGQLQPKSIVLFGGSKLKLKNFGYGLQLLNDPMQLPSFHRHRAPNQYTPPQASSMQITSRSDIYSFGCIISQLFHSIKAITTRQSQFLSHIAPFVSRMKAVNPSQRPSLQQVSDYFNSKPYEKKIVTLKPPSMKKKSMSNEQNLAKLKLRHFPNNDLSALVLDFNRQARKILAKRNFQKFMMEIALLCGRLPLSSQQSLTLGVVMTKKAVILAGQLVKVMKTGSGDTLRIDERTFSRLSNQKHFLELQIMLVQQIEELKELFDMLSKAIKEKLPKQKNQKLHEQLVHEKINANFLKKISYIWLADASEWLKNQFVRPPKKDLILLCVFLFLLDYPTMQQGFSILCGQNGVDLWQQPLFSELGNMSDYNLQRLIILQSEGKVIQDSAISSGRSSRVKE